MLFKIVLKDAKICYDVMQNIFQDSWLYKIHIIWPTREREREREREKEGCKWRERLITQ